MWATHCSLGISAPSSKMKNYLHLNLALLMMLLFLLFCNQSHQYFFPPHLTFLNPRLMEAYVALQAWKLAIISDPNGFTTNWYGPHVCNYTGVYCAPAPDDPSTLTVAGVDLNHADVAGFLPEKLGLLKDLALFHINSNRFYGTVPASFIKLHLLQELDISNNKFGGPFPGVVLFLPSLIYLDIRFNEFCGEIPSQVFDLKLDALFLNDNKFHSSLPENIGNSPVSVFVVANNDIGGCVPQSLGNMACLEEIVLSNLRLKGCLRQEIGRLKRLKVLDLSFNELVGPLPESIGQMKKLEQLNVGHNKLSGQIPGSVCGLPKLENFIYSFNYFSGEPSACLRLRGSDDRGNCIPNRPLQRSLEDCTNFYAHPATCSAKLCFVW